MNQEFPSQTSRDPGTSGEVNENAISGEELRTLREQHARNMGRASVQTLSPKEQRYKAESEARGGSPYFSTTPPTQEQINKAAQYGFDIKSNWNKYNTKQI